MVVGEKFTDISQRPEGGEDRHLGEEKTPRQEQVWHVQGGGRKALWLEHGERGEVQMMGPSVISSDPREATGGDWSRGMK